MRSDRRVKRYVWAGSLLAAVVTVGAALRGSPVLATFGRVERGPLSATVSGEGRTRVKDLYVVSAPVDGSLERVLVEPGDPVALDASVAEVRPGASRPLDPRTRAQAIAAATAARAAVERADAAEREAQVALQHARSNLSRAQKLAPSGALPAAEEEHSGHELEIRRRAAEAGAAAARQARAELTRAQAALAADLPGGGLAVAVRAPAAGRVLRVLRKSAGPVAAGTPLLELGDVARLEISAELLSSDAARVRPGARATVKGWGGPDPLPARVRRIDPAAYTKVSALGLEEQRVQVILDLAGAPPAGLGHDYRVDVAVVIWEGQEVLRVPTTALFRTGDRWAVFAVRDGRARRTPVTVGPGDGTWTAASDGVREGDMVITQPSDAIADGTRVARLP